MPFKPNYNQQRAERNRAKREKKEEKLKEQRERTARRKGEVIIEPEGDGKPPTSR
jgi:hypothetical protein